MGRFAIRPWAQDADSDAQHDADRHRDSACRAICDASGAFVDAQFIDGDDHIYTDGDCHSDTHGDLYRLADAVPAPDVHGDFHPAHIDEYAAADRHQHVGSAHTDVHGDSHPAHIDEYTAADCYRHANLRALVPCFDDDRNYSFPDVVTLGSGLVRL